MIELNEISRLHGTDGSSIERIFFLTDNDARHRRYGRLNLNWENLITK
jgi:hypothetical protein